VLELDVSEAIELGLVAIGHETEGVPVSEGFLDTELAVKGLEGHRGGGLLGGRKGGGRGEEGGKESELHVNKDRVYGIMRARNSCRPIQSTLKCRIFLVESSTCRSVVFFGKGRTDEEPDKPVQLDCERF
jgi:Fe-S-cluster containining protein